MMHSTRVLFLASFLILSPLLISGCSEISEAEVKIRQEFPSIPSDMPIKNLGEIEFVSGLPKEIKLDDGQFLEITATKQHDDTIQVLIEYGSTKQSVTRLVTESYSEQSKFLLKPGMRCAPKLGDDLAIVFKPRVIESDSEDAMQ